MTLSDKQEYISGLAVNLVDMSKIMTEAPYYHSLLIKHCKRDHFKAEDLKGVEGLAVPLLPMPLNQWLSIYGIIREGILGQRGYNKDQFRIYKNRSGVWSKI